MTEPEPSTDPVTDYLRMMGAPEPGPAPPDILTFAELLADQSLLLAKEQTDKSLIESIGTQNAQALKPRLVEWVMKGCPSAFPILSLDIRPPAQCSDGETRDLPEYIEFCSGKTISEHVALLQAKLPDIQVSFANICGVTTIVVLKT